MEALEGAPGRPAAAQEEIVNEEATRGAMPVDPESILRTSLIYQRLDSLGLCGHLHCLFLHHNDGSAGAPDRRRPRRFPPSAASHWPLLRGLATRRHAAWRP